jgi:hypothetical protein
LNELAKKIARPSSEEGWSEAMDDYLILLHRIPGDDKEKRDELTHWLIVFHRQQNEDALSVSLSEWKRTGQLTWLLAVLSKINSKSPSLNEIMKAAEAVPVTSPAFPTVAYHRARLLIEKGEVATATSYLDSLLKMSDDIFPLSSKNILLELRVPLSTGWKEFLSLAPRQPDGYWSGDSSVAFSWETEEILFRGVPLKTQAKIISEGWLPKPMRLGYAVSAWVKAVLIQNDPVALQIAKKIAAESSSLKETFTAYLTAPTLEDRRHEGALILLKNQLMEPGQGHALERTSFDERPGRYSGRWWCFKYEPATPRLLPADPYMSPVLMTPEEKNLALTEWNQVMSLEPAETYLTQAILKWQREKPRDPRIPGALDLLSQRLDRNDSFSECLSAEETTTLLKEVDQVLKQKYPTYERPVGKEVEP